jgi:hypothetical protein
MEAQVRESREEETRMQEASQRWSRQFHLLSIGAGALHFKLGPPKRLARSERS